MPGEIKRKERRERPLKGAGMGARAPLPPPPEIRAEEWKEMTREAKVGLEVISYK